MESCNDSVVVIVGKGFKRDIDICNKPIFATSYRSFKNLENSFGAFYWRKGRPQIKFKVNIINKYDLRLPNSLERYAK
jgi:hypothetical protein